MIDVQVTVASLDDARLDAAFADAELRLGPVLDGGDHAQPGVPVSPADVRKRLARETEGRRVHVHVREAGRWNQRYALLFRDYLRAHPEVARQYADLKRGLAARFGSDREGYTEAKTEFVRATEVKARAWRRETAPPPGPSPTA